MSNPNLDASNAAVTGLSGMAKVVSLMAQFTEGLDLDDPKDLEIARARYAAHVKAVAEARKRGELE